MKDNCFFFSLARWQSQIKRARGTRLRNRSKLCVNVQPSSFQTLLHSQKKKSQRQLKSQQIHNLIIIASESRRKWKLCGKCLTRCSLKISYGHICVFGLILNICKACEASQRKVKSKTCKGRKSDLNMYQL